MAVFEKPAVTARSELNRQGAQDTCHSEKHMAGDEQGAYYPRERWDDVTERLRILRFEYHMDRPTVQAIEDFGETPLLVASGASCAVRFSPSVGRSNTLRS